MTEKKGLTLAEFETATAGLDGSVGIVCNGETVHGIILDRNDAGDLQANLQGTPVSEVVVSPPDTTAADDTDRMETLSERRKNDPASLSDEEREELTHLETLAGVPEQRMAIADTGSEGDPL